MTRSYVKSQKWGYAILKMPKNQASLPSDSIFETAFIGIGQEMVAKSNKMNEIK